MKKTITILFTILGFLAFGKVQNPEKEGEIASSIEPEILDSLYVKALNNRVDILPKSGWQYVEMNEYGARIKNFGVSARFKFLTTEELIGVLLKEKRPIDVLRVVHKVISKDTVDINFGYIRLKGKRKWHFSQGLRFKEAEISVGCVGTNGYQPNIRFVFNSASKEWEITRNQSVKTLDE